MPIGTRVAQHKSNEHAASAQPNGRFSRDIGMKKRVLPATATFTAANGRITGSNGDFSNFAAGDVVVIYGTKLNNGEHNVVAVDGANGAYLQLDWPCKDEGPLATVEVRTV